MDESQAKDGEAAQVSRFAVGFTRNEGWAGWLRAKLRRARFFGAGAIEIQQENVIVQGQERTWLGVQTRGHYLIERGKIVGALRFKSRVRLRWRRAPFGTWSMEFQAQSEEEAAKIVDAVLKGRLSATDENWLALQSFQERTRSETPFPWITAGLVTICCAVFFAMLVRQRAFEPFDLATLIAWGANTSAQTLGGEWWRLITALFLHGHLLHLAVNMWVLLQVGRLTERIYGRWPFLAIYLLSGCCAGLASLLWKSPMATVGASGAIFGVVGAFLVSLQDRASVPRALARSHWISTLIFLLYNLLAGASAPLVDNAAHVGGLLSGALFGYALLRPWQNGFRLRPPTHRLLIGLGMPIAILALAFGETTVVARQLSGPERYWKDHQWFQLDQARVLRSENEFFHRAQTGAFSDAQLKVVVESDVLKPWKAISKRLVDEPPNRSGAEATYGEAVSGFVASKVAWAEAVTATLDDGTRNSNAENRGLEVRNAAARLQRLDMRAALSKRPRTLADLPLFAWIRGSVDRQSAQCVHSPAAYGPNVSPDDSKADAPALEDAAGCLAQKLFLAGRYADLDQSLQSSFSTNERLFGGASAYLAMLDGLETLFSYGGLEAEDVFRRTSDWRAAVPGSLHAELAEASALEAWAWDARGHGFAKTVSAQNWQLFAVRLEMTAAALEEIEPRAQDNPAWHEHRINLALSRDEAEERRDAAFRDAIARFPDELALYRARIRSLMPRWSGSHEKVRLLIEEANARSAEPQSNERYAALYATDAYLEGSETDFFEATEVDWGRMKSGLMSIYNRHPQSDFALNRLAHFACMANDAELYAWAAPKLAGRISATAWRNGVTRQGCDKKFAARKL